MIECTKGLPKCINITKCINIITKCNPISKLRGNESFGRIITASENISEVIWSGISTIYSIFELILNFWIIVCDLNECIDCCLAHINIATIYQFSHFRAIFEEITNSRISDRIVNNGQKNLIIWIFLFCFNNRPDIELWIESFSDLFIINRNKNFVFGFDFIDNNVFNELFVLKRKADNCVHRRIGFLS